MASAIYLEIKKNIIESIKDKLIGTPIASERELAVQFATSRMTVRKAVTELVEEGYLYRYKNRGTFVADWKLHKRNTAVDILLKKGRSVPKLLYFNVKEIPQAAKRLNLKENDLVLRAVRLITRDERPITVEEIHFPYKNVHHTEIKALEEVLDVEKYVENGTLTQRFIPMLVPPQYSNLLCLEMGTPIIMVDSIIHDKTGNPVALVKLYHNPKEKIIEITS